VLFLLVPLWPTATSGAADRHHLFRAVRRQPAFHHGPGLAWCRSATLLISALGAYAAALLFKTAGLPMELAWCWPPFVAGLFAVVLWLVLRAALGRLSRHADTRLRADQLVVVFQWDSLTSGSNGLVGIWPSMWLSGKPAYYYMTLVCAPRHRLPVARPVLALRYVLRAGRDSPLRAEAIGIDVRAFQWMPFVLAARWPGWPARSSPSQGQHLALGHLDRPIDRCL